MEVYPPKKSNTIKKAAASDTYIFCNKKICRILLQHYSTIYPATSSPSASGKSNGTRAFLLKLQ